VQRIQEAHREKSGVGIVGVRRFKWRCSGAVWATACGELRVALRQLSGRLPVTGPAWRGDVGSGTSVRAGEASNCWLWWRSAIAGLRTGTNKTRLNAGAVVLIAECAGAVARGSTSRRKLKFCQVCPSQPSERVAQPSGVSDSAWSRSCCSRRFDATTAASIESLSGGQVLTGPEKVVDVASPDSDDAGCFPNCRGLGRPPQRSAISVSSTNGGGLWAGSNWPQCCDLRPLVTMRSTFCPPKELVRSPRARSPGLQQVCPGSHGGSVVSGGSLRRLVKRSGNQASVGDDRTLAGVVLHIPAGPGRTRLGWTEPWPRWGCTPAAGWRWCRFGAVHCAGIPRARVAEEDSRAGVWRGAGLWAATAGVASPSLGLFVAAPTSMGGDPLCAAQAAFRVPEAPAWVVRGLGGGHLVRSGALLCVGWAGKGGWSRLVLNGSDLGAGKLGYRAVPRSGSAAWEPPLSARGESGPCGPALGPSVGAAWWWLRARRLLDRSGCSGGPVEASGSVGERAAKVGCDGESGGDRERGGVGFATLDPCGVCKSAAGVGVSLPLPASSRAWGGFGSRVCSCCSAAGVLGPGRESKAAAGNGRLLEQGAWLPARPCIGLPLECWGLLAVLGKGPLAAGGRQNWVVPRFQELGVN